MHVVSQHLVHESSLLLLLRVLGVECGGDTGEGVAHASCASMHNMVNMQAVRGRVQLRGAAGPARTWSSG